MTNEYIAPSNKPESQPALWLRIALWTLLAMVGTLAIYATRPPAPRDLQTPPEEFSAERAMALLPRIVARPHPLGTRANEAVRKFLVDRLQQLGAEVRIERTIGVINRGRFVRAGSVQNIVATLPGRHHGRALMLAAHYDSVPEGPGAADDGAGLIVILETLRALRSTRLSNDLIILFTDGEEAGLLGAAGFVADHPDLAQTVGVVLNLEARGSSGPALMFETSEENGWLIPEFARGAPYPVASSLMYSIYKLLPNDTDLSELKRTGVFGLNFAFAESLQNYHTRLDTLQNLDPGSVQEMGANVLALVRRLGEAPLNNVRRPDCVYFNWFGHALMVYPLLIVRLLIFLGFALLILVRILGRHTPRIRFRVMTLAIFVLLLLGVGGGMVLLWSAIYLLFGSHLLVGDTPSNLLLFGGLILIGLLLGMNLLGYSSQRLGWRNLTFGLLFSSLILGTVVSLLLPGGSYLFQWPVIFGSVSLLLSLHLHRSPARILVGLVAALPALLILGPLIYLFFVVMGLNAISLVITSILLTLLLGVSWPFLAMIQLSRDLTVLMLFIGLALITSGIAFSHPSRLHPRLDHLIYSLNADQHKAMWLSDDEQTDAWSQQYLGGHPRKEMDPEFRLGTFREALTADAPLIGVAPPAAQLIEDRGEKDIRFLQLHLASPRNASTLSLTLPADIDLLAVKWNGRSQEIRTAGELQLPWRLRFEALPPQGVDLELKVRAKSALTLWLGDLSEGLPPVTGQNYNARPDNLMAGSGSDVTIVSRQITF